LFFLFFFFFFFFFLFIICSILAISFFTLIEQKIIASRQLRLGPHYRGYVGFLQPFCDAIKLYSKYNKIFFLFSNLIFTFLPYFLLFIFCFLWFLNPIMWVSFDINIGALFFLLIISVGGIIILIISWFSNCKYSILGGLRSVSQIVSYDVCFGFIFLCICFLIKSLNICYIRYYMSFLVLSLIPIFFCWFFSILAERNRTPFDFVEGESELVSGFNTEYSGGPFALCFISEYISILFMSYLGFFMFFFFNPLLGFSTIVFCYLYILVRCFLPRYRYDKLMLFCWKVLLPGLVLFLTFFRCIF